MGAIHFSVRDFYDASCEYIGIKSGLLLERSNIRLLLLEKFEDDFLQQDRLERYLRIRAEDLEDMFLHIRRRIGNLPMSSQITEQYLIMRNYTIKTGDITFVASAPSLVNRHLHNNRNLTAHDIAELIRHEKRCPLEVALAMAQIGLERYDQSCVLPESIEWNATTKLSDLFDCEIKSENDHEFIDQKFLDYLAVNGHEIEDIHWRNFERFCAEYFRKEGYHVDLGPGTNDGGIDIRVYNTDGANKSKPYILVQCKRYKTHRKVSIEAVKAFYDDVRFENADSGLIATSSYIASGGKKVCETRGYNLSFAESNNVKNWAKKMWHYSQP